MLVCKDALELSRRLIFSNQQLYQEDLETKFASMQASLGPLIGLEPVDSISAMVSNATAPLSMCNHLLACCFTGSLVAFVRTCEWQISCTCTSLILV